MLRATTTKRQVPEGSMFSLLSFVISKVHQTRNGTPLGIGFVECSWKQTQKVFFGYLATSPWVTVFTGVSSVLEFQLSTELVGIFLSFENEQESA